MSTSFYRGAAGALIVYDITNVESFNNLDKWIKELKSNAENPITTLIIGNKSDKPDRTVSIDTSSAFATKQKCGLIETSAMDASNVEIAFETLLREIVQKKINSPETEGAKYPSKIGSKNIEVGKKDPIQENKNCLCCASS